LITEVLTHYFGFPGYVGTVDCLVIFSFSQLVFVGVFKRKNLLDISRLFMQVQKDFRLCPLFYLNDQGVCILLECKITLAFISVFFNVAADFFPDIAKGMMQEG
jgi:hypothetical protein